MKCIKMTMGEKVLRVKDEVAFEMVKKGSAHFCSKNDFRAFKGVKVKVNQHKQIINGHLRAQVAQEMGIPVNPEVRA